MHLLRLLYVPLALVLVACSDDTDPATGGGSTGGADTGGTSSNGGEGVGAGTTDGGAPGVGGMGGGGGSVGGGSDGGGGGGSGEDLDGDGIPEAEEDELARSYRPFLSIHPDDGCTLGGIVYRVHPHPDDAAMIHIVYDHLFESDCGFPSHVGDNEAFGVTIDPSVPPPGGIISIVAIGHQGTACEQVSMCGTCGGFDACITAPLGGEDYPVVYSSKDKHASYTKVCGVSNCFDSCELAGASADPPMVNAGEPEAPLVSNLSTEGFINDQNGWTEAELFDIDPWDTMTDFGGAGNIAGDLVDPAFVPCAP